MVEYCGIWQNPAQYFGLAWDIVEYRKLLWKHAEYFRLWWNIVPYIGILYNIVEYGRIWWNVVAYGGIWWSLVELDSVKPNHTETIEQPNDQMTRRSATINHYYLLLSINIHYYPLLFTMA